MGISGFPIVSGNDVQIVKDIKKARGIKLLMVLKSFVSNAC